MIITDFLVKNAKEFGDEAALIEINPDSGKQRSGNWAEFALV